MIIPELQEIVPKCADVSCGNPLGYFEIKNNRRFCRACLVVADKVLRWKCKTCTIILDNTKYRETRMYCDSCKGMAVQF